MLGQESDVCLIKHEKFLGNVIYIVGTGNKMDIFIFILTKCLTIGVGEYIISHMERKWTIRKLQRSKNAYIN